MEDRNTENYSQGAKCLYCRLIENEGMVLSRKFLSRSYSISFLNESRRAAEDIVTLAMYIISTI